MSKGVDDFYTTLLMIGKIGSIRHKGSGNIRFNVVVLASRENYGAINYLVRPEKGEGEAWVAADSILFIAEA